MRRRDLLAGFLGVARWIEHVKLLGAAHPRTTLMSSVALSTACPHFVLDF